MRGRLVTPRRLAMAGVCLLSLVVCCGLALWQWERFESANGSWQNLGYVLQWPLFGLFPAFLFWRMRQLRIKHAALAGERPPPSAVPPGPVPRVRDDDRGGPRGDHHRDRLDDLDDPELAAYNRFLAELNARDRQEAP